VPTPFETCLAEVRAALAEVRNGTAVTRKVLVRESGRAYFVEVGTEPEAGTSELAQLRAENARLRLQFSHEDEAHVLLVAENARLREAARRAVELIEAPRSSGGVLIAAEGLRDALEGKESDDGK
jgi:hypothetical protein